MLQIYVLIFLPYVFLSTDTSQRLVGEQVTLSGFYRQENMGYDLAELISPESGGHQARLCLQRSLTWVLLAQVSRGGTKSDCLLWKKKLNVHF